MIEIRTRIAPSPTGDWHLGNARTALFAYLFARHHKGKFFLRIEDTDQNRLVEGAVERLLEVIAWIGLTPDPFEGDAYVVQSERLARYQEVAHQLVADGQAYYCFATPEELQHMRDEQAAHKLPPHYDNRWGYRDMAIDEAKDLMASRSGYVIRQKMPQSGAITVSDAIHGNVVVEAVRLDDHVLLKADGYPTYHLAHVVDDCDMEITHVIRGDEWLPSAPRHVALHHALGWNVPTYVHLPIILGPDKGKLSKRHGAKTVNGYMEAGYLPEAVRNYLLFLGWSSGTEQEIYDFEAMIASFSLDRLGASPAKFDAARLDWFNAHYLRSLPLDDIVQRIVTYTDAIDPVWRHRFEGDDAKFRRVVTAVRERMVTLADWAGLAEVFYTRPTQWQAELVVAKGQDLSQALAVIRSVHQALTNVTEVWTQDRLKSLLDDLVVAQAVKVGQLYLPVRYALSGVPTSPGTLEILEILGQTESLARLEACLDSLT